VSERAKRQSFLGSESVNVLHDLRVGVVGLGGGGSHVVQQLAHLGVGNYTLVDPDRIEESNLNRLVGGTAADVKASRKKTVIAARQIARIYPGAHITSISCQWQLVAEKLRCCDIIFGCIDSFGGRRQLEEAARRFMIPYVDIGMDVVPDGRRFSIVGQVALSMPGRPCLRCMGVVRNSDVAEEARRYDAAGDKPQVVWPNGVLASIAVGIAMQLIVPWHDAHVECALFEYNGNTNTIVKSNVLQELSATCPHFGDINALGDPWFGLGAAVLG
jgi:hypothetical protein